MYQWSHSKTGSENSLENPGGNPEWPNLFRSFILYRLFDHFPKFLLKTFSINLEFKWLLASPPPHLDAYVFIAHIRSNRRSEISHIVFFVFVVSFWVGLGKKLEIDFRFQERFESNDFLTCWDLFIFLTFQARQSVITHWFRVLSQIAVNIHFNSIWEIREWYGYSIFDSVLLLNSKVIPFPTASQKVLAPCPLSR